MTSTSCCVVGIFPLQYNWLRGNYTKSSSISFFQKISEKQVDTIQQERCEDEKSTIFCKMCQHPITFPENKIEINGQHRHVFSNPVGFSYEIGCFSLANGCINKGVASLEYTWFKGFFWRFAICSKCYSHLGWVYQSGNDSFYGLILETLEER
ncbi:MAG: hypothetical protein KAH77_02735 [Thiomargarita sp.]|nr:hypothetical protein [Thiomargarita sp.]